MSADEELWEIVRKNVLDTGIYFDRELIPDEILRLIVNAFVIEKCGEGK